MKSNKLTGRIRLAAVAALALLVAACAAAPMSQPAAEEAPAKVYHFEPWDGDGMEIPLDGSSLDAFETSLARVQAHTSPENYTTLENAIKYLMLYDLSVKRDKAMLAQKLDGKTPYEVLEQVQWRKPAPGKSRAEKGAADATIEI